MRKTRVNREGKHGCYKLNERQMYLCWQVCGLILESADAVHSALCVCVCVRRHAFFNTPTHTFCSVRCLTFSSWNNGEGARGGFEKGDVASWAE